MNSWLKKWIQWKISTALDDPKARSAWVADAIAGSDELQQFERATAMVHRQLEENRAEAAMPCIHDSIMNAVRASARPLIVRPSYLIPRWIFGPAAAAVVLAGAWWLFRPATEPDVTASNSLRTGEAVLEIGDQIQPAIESATVLSLSTELKRVNDDLDEMTRFLLASLP